MAFKGRDPVRTKIVIDNKIMGQVYLFNYLGNMISCEGELDIDNKLSNFLKNLNTVVLPTLNPYRTNVENRVSS